MRRYWLPLESRESNETLRIEGESFHHIVDVCRQGVGSRFEVLFGDQRAHLVEITEVGKREAYARYLETREIAPLERPYLHLCLSIPRFPIFDAVLEKSVELGAAAIHPFYSDFSFVKKKDSVSESRIERWQKIIKSATQQSGRGDLLELSTPLELSDCLKEFNQKSNAAGLFSYEGDSKLHIREWATKLRSQKSEPDEIWLFLGSEGGFSEKEVEKFQQFRLEPITLGSQVLRVETACVALLSVLKYEWNLMK